MAITGITIGNNVLGQSQVRLTDQLASLSTQLTTGKKATTYAGMGVNEGFAIAARSQLSNIDAFTDIQSKVETTIGVANVALQSIVSIGSQVRKSAAQATQTIGSSGQTTAQQTATAQLSSMLGILNTQAGDRYVFSGSAIDTPSVASADDILDGKGSAAGLKTVISERRQADLGAAGLGRVVVTQPTTTSVSVAEDAASPFGLKLNTINSSLTGATVTGPTGTPPAVSVDLGATIPTNGDKISFTFDLPDGTMETISLTASSAVPTPAGSFAIGATPDATAANLTTAVSTAIGTLANTALVAASAMQASDDFFGAPPQRVSGTPLNSATALVNGTDANTVSWYTGEAGAGSARATATTRIDQSVTIQYGARANEDGIRNQLKAIAAFAAVTATPASVNAGAQVSALSQRVTNALTAQTGQQSVTDIQSEFAAAQVTSGDVKSRQAQTKTMLQTIVDQAENVSSDEVATQILALQNALSASYQTTSLLSKLTLTNFL